MKQAQALDILKDGRNVYLTGPAGSGKTHVLREYIEYLSERGVTAALTASTGIAATHIGGVTIHSWSGMGIKDSLSESDIDLLTQREHLWKRYQKTSVLIIDEVSMITPKFFDSLDQLARAMKQNNAPFGGMQIVLSGDFFQLPPIVRGSTEPEFIYSSRAWEEADIRICYLSEQYRQDEGVLTTILEEIRKGTVSEESRTHLESRSRDEDVIDDYTPTRLYTHNVDVDALNERELEKLPGDIFEYQMVTKGRAKVVEPLKKGLLAPEVLSLKEGAVVMFVKNNFEAGYVNGTLGVVADFDDDDFPIVETLSGKRIPVYPAEWRVEDNGKVLASVSQLPLRLAWAITVHKSQGMSLDAAEIDLSRCFVSGQGYVALSRLRSIEGLTLRGLNSLALEVNQGVREFDAHARRESEKWEQVICRFAPEEMSSMHGEFIDRSGGTNDDSEIKKNKARAKDGAGQVEERVSTYEKTRQLVEKGLSLEEIVEERGMALSTIITHLEKLKQTGADVELGRFAPGESDLERIRDAFEDSGDTKLAPVFKALDGEYTFEELRIARLFL